MRVCPSLDKNSAIILSSVGRLEKTHKENPDEKSITNPGLPFLELPLTDTMYHTAKSKYYCVTVVKHTEKHI